MVIPNINKDEPPAEPDLVQRLLNFANLPEVRTATEVEAIFKDALFAQRSPVWNSIADPNDIADFVKMHEILKGWLKTIIAGTWPEQEKVRATALAGFQEKATLDFPIRIPMPDGQIQERTEKLWGRPRLDFYPNGDLKISVEPFVNGVEASVYFAVILIFQLGLRRRLKVCKLRLESGTTCGRFFLYRPDLRRFCSPEHARLGPAQALHEWHDTQREKEGLPPMRWGSRPYASGPKAWGQNAKAKKSSRGRSRRGKGGRKKRRV